jgi:hypothetical protein
MRHRGLDDEAIDAELVKEARAHAAGRSPINSADWRRPGDALMTLQLLQGNPEVAGEAGSQRGTAGEETGGKAAETGSGATGPASNL